MQELSGVALTTLPDVPGVLYDNYRATLRAFTQALNARDLETEAHSQRVAAYSLRLGIVMGLDELSLLGLEQGALLHDIGKIGIRDHILLKPGPLTADERLTMRSHVQHGLRIVQDVTMLRPARSIIGQHHERFDGSGYPSGLSGDEIHIHARIFAVADALDALLSDRPYRKAQSFEYAKGELLANSGTQFDPEVLETFTAVTQPEWLLLRDETALRTFIDMVTGGSAPRWILGVTHSV